MSLEKPKDYCHFDGKKVCTLSNVMLCIACQMKAKNDIDRESLKATQQLAETQKAIAQAMTPTELPGADEIEKQKGKGYG